MSKNKEHKTEAIVLKWVKLRESDAIIKMIDTLGCLIEGVARGARKPNNSSSSKLEPFNCIEVFLVEGKGLDVIKDSRTLQRNKKLREDPCKFACASCLSELLCKTLQPDIDVGNMYDLTKKYISLLEEVPDSKRLCLTSATLLKASAYLGFMPSFNKCVGCGKDVDAGATSRFSHIDGGIVCDNCRNQISYINFDPTLLVNANAFLHMTLNDIITSNVDDNVGATVLQFACSWIKAQAGITLKSYPLALEICAC